MFESLPLPAAGLAFIVAAIAVWFAGTRLSSTTEQLADRFHFGQAVGGLVVLAIATNLPEIAISISAARSGNVEVAVGNILGGIGIQTVVLVIIDAVVRRPSGPLTFRARSLVIALEGLVVVVMLAAVLMISQLPATATLGRVETGCIILVAIWIGGLVLVRNSRAVIPWHTDDARPDHRGNDNDHKSRKPGTRRTVTVFAIAAIVTLFGGFVLEQSGDVLASDFGLSGVVFGATFLALATSLPEISTGIASSRTGEDDLAISDIFGGNAFLPVLFLPIGLVAGQPALSGAQAPDLYLTALGIILTAIYVVGLIVRSRRKTIGIGRDSVAVLIAYLVGLAGLIMIAAS